MTTPRAILGSLLVLMTLPLLAGCFSQVESRIQEKATAYGRLDAATQQHIRQGLIEKGYTKDMVYMALGAPTANKSTPTHDGGVETWIYKNMMLAGKAGFRGLSYNTMLDGSSSPSFRSSTARSKQAYAPIDQAQMDAATELPDLPMGTLYVYFFQDRVYKMVFEK